MIEEKVIEQNEDDIPEKKGFIAWVKENKKQLLLAGVSVSALIMTILGLKNKDAINVLWKSLKGQIEKGSLFSAKWFEKASLEELNKQREIVMLDSMNPNLDMDYRIWCRNMLPVFDNAMDKFKRAGEEVGYPVHSSNGWHLPSDD